MPHQVGHDTFDFVIPLRGLTAAGIKCESTSGLSLDTLACHSRLRAGGQHLELCSIVRMATFRWESPFYSTQIFFLAMYRRFLRAFFRACTLRETLLLLSPLCSNSCRRIHVHSSGSEYRTPRIPFCRCPKILESCRKPSRQSR